jgi:hypothetical protein
LEQRHRPRSRVLLVALHLLEPPRSSMLLLPIRLVRLSRPQHLAVGLDNHNNSNNNNSNSRNNSLLALERLEPPQRRLLKTRLVLLSLLPILPHQRLA